MEKKFDLIVIGAGPGGYTAAIKAAKLGLETAIVEAGAVGGTCLNRGCIPAKAMIHAASLYQEIQTSESFGIHGAATYDYQEILSYKEGVTAQLSQGVEQLLGGNQVTLLRGWGQLRKDGSVVVSGDGEEHFYHGVNVLLAAGSKPLLPPIEGLDLPGVLTSDELFLQKEVPESLLIIGGGVISVEFASIFQGLGTKVTIVEAMPRLVPNMDKEISQNLRMILKKRGIDIHTAAFVKRIEQEGTQLRCVFTEKEQEVEVVASDVLCAVGRGPNTEQLFESGLKPQMEQGRIVVDENFATSIPGVYAIGDLIPGAQLAHVASAQGIYVAEMLAGREPLVDLTVIPSCVYTDPEIASVGLTEEEAKARGITVRVGKFIMNANGRSLLAKEERGFIKIVAAADSNTILGAQMMCGRATDMIGELGVAIANEMTVQQLLKAMRAHPTYNEGVGEALEDLLGEAIHIMPRRK